MRKKHNNEDLGKKATITVQADRLMAFCEENAIEAREDVLYELIYYAHNHEKLRSFLAPEKYGIVFCANKLLGDCKALDEQLASLIKRYVIIKEVETQEKEQFFV